MRSCNNSSSLTWPHPPSFTRLSEKPTSWPPKRTLPPQPCDSPLASLLSALCPLHIPTFACAALRTPSAPPVLSVNPFLSHPSAWTSLWSLCRWPRFHTNLPPPHPPPRLHPLEAWGSHTFPCKRITTDLLNADSWACPQTFWFRIGERPEIHILNKYPREFWSSDLMSSEGLY